MMTRLKYFAAALFLLIGFSSIAQDKINFSKFEQGYLVKLNCHVKDKSQLTEFKKILDAHPDSFSNVSLSPTSPGTIKFICTSTKLEKTILSAIKECKINDFTNVE